MAPLAEQLTWWVKQADHDLEAAKLQRSSGIYDYCALACQQSVEKFLKALLMHRHQTTPPKIHQCQRLAETLNAPESVLHAAMWVEKAYMECRYPDAASGVPFEQFTDADCATRIQRAEEVKAWVLQQLST